MTKKLPAKFREYSIDDEITVSVKLIQKGLFELKNIDKWNTFLHLPMLLLSNGFERLMNFPPDENYVGE